MDYLNQAERAELGTRRQKDPFVEDVLRQRDRVLASRTFQRVQKLARDFLSFVISMKLLGKETGIKEATVAIQVFHLPSDYNTAESTRIREAARNLRIKLSAYFTGEGRSDPIEISIPKGTYIPEIRDRRTGITIAFENWNINADHEHLCNMVTDEIIDHLRRVGAIEAARMSAHESRISKLTHSLRGRLECQGDKVLLNASLSDLKTGQIIYSQRFEGPRDDIFKLLRQVSAVIIGALSPGQRSPTQPQRQSRSS